MKKRAFTLIELLIASAISTVVIISLYSAFQTGILSYKRIDAASEAYQDARILFARLEIDLRNAFKYLQEDSGFIGNTDSLEFYSILDYYANGKPETNVCRLKYILGASNMERYCYKGIDSLKPEVELAADKICPNIRALFFSYAYPTGQLNKPYEWSQVWPPEKSQANSLPLAVRIKLTLVEKGSRQNTVEFTKTVPLLL